MIPDPLGEALSWLREGGLLAYPTETVWGLGADARSELAVERLWLWKGRDGDAPVAILVKDAEALVGLGFDLGRAGRRLAEAFWPGPLTLVMHCDQTFAPGIARDDGAVGVRCSAHPLARAVARRVDREGLGPITATSLNRSGEAAAARRGEALDLCGDALAMPRMLRIEEAETGGDAPSTVVDLTGSSPRVLRWGALSSEELDPVLQEVAVS